MAVRASASEKKSPSILLDLFLTFFAAFLVILLAAMAIIVGHSVSTGSLSAASFGYSAGGWQSSSAECAVSPNFPEEVRQWCGWITQYALETGLPPDLIAAMIWQESGGNPDAYSHSGAVGLMQVMPRDGLAASFECRGVPCFEDRPTIAELRDPEFNIRYGTYFLRDLINIYEGDVRAALRAYGPMDMGYGYADIIISLYYQYGAPPEP